MHFFKNKNKFNFFSLKMSICIKKRCGFKPETRKMNFELKKTDRDNLMIMGIVLYEGTFEGLKKVTL